MNTKSILEKIKKQNLYQNILEIEGVKDPIFNFEKLDLAAENIHDRFNKLGLSVTEQQFTVEGFDGTFRNIEATLQNSSASADEYVVLTSHYDTVPNTIGANDNASAIALQFEIARVLTKEDLDLNVKFVSFTLEELNPYLIGEGIKKSQELGLRDAHNRVSSYHFNLIRKKMNKMVSQFETEVSSREEGIHRSIIALKSEMTPEEIEYFTLFQTFNSNSSAEDYDRVGLEGLIGSSRWVDHQKQIATNIKCVYNFDEIAFTSKKKYSHSFPEGLPLAQLPQYKVQVEDQVGDFIALLSDNNSEWMLNSLFKHAETLDLPYLGVPSQMDYPTLKTKMPQMLYADHAPFWRARIPCIFITDMGEFRSPYAHNMGDTIDHLDFDFLEKVTQMTLGALLEEL